MPFFRVLLHGKDVHIPAAGSAVPIIGFYTTRVVRAASYETAEAAAIALVSAEWSKPPLSKQNKGAAPALKVEQVSQVTLLKALRAKNRGFTFYGQE